MSESSYITKLRESQTLVASRFVPRVIAPPPIINNTFTLPNGFSINPTSPNTVDVNINGNLNVSGGIDPIFLQLKPQTNQTTPFTQFGTLWVQTYNDNINRFTLKLDNNTIYDTTNVHLIENISNLSFQTIKTRTLTTDYLSTFTNTNSSILVNTSLVPANNTYTLGNDTNYWSSIYTSTLFIRPNTIYVVDDNGKQISISYNVDKGTSFITKDDITVETVTTSKNIPGIIDPSLLPFSGLSFSSKINISDFKQNIGNSLVTQLLYSLYTLDKSIINSHFSIPLHIIEHSAPKLMNLLNGNYYIVENTNRNIEEIKLPKIRASTNFGTTQGTVDITSLFIIESEENISITDGDILIIYSSYVPNGDNYDIIFGFQNINFRLPINSIVNSNIVDNTITTSKLRDNTITENKIANSSISLRTLSNDVINLLNRNIDNNGISSIICLCNDLENKITKLEKFINIFAQTYFIKDTLSDTLITLDNINDIVF